jgi:ankyrin repeat protein
MGLSIGDIDTPGCMAEKRRELQRDYVNLQDDSGRTALHHGAENGHAEICQILMDYGADPLIMTKDGQTACDLARKGGYADVVEILSRYV